MPRVTQVSIYSEHGRGPYAWRWTVRYIRNGLLQWSCGGGLLTRDQANGAAMFAAWDIQYS